MPPIPVDQVHAAAGDTPEEIARDVHAVGQIAGLPLLLDALCEVSGMRFAAVARVSEAAWIACAVKDGINFGLKSGDRLDVQTTLCIESRRAGEPIVIEHASADPRYRDHRTPRQHGFESCISVPIVLEGGRYFGNLCAVDPLPVKVADPTLLRLFTRFAASIAAQLDSELEREQEQVELRDEREVREWREHFIAVLGHDLRNPLQAIHATSSLLERKLASQPALAGMAERIKINSLRMSSMINDVLDFARGRLGGGIGVDLGDSVDVSASLQSIVKELQDGRPDRQIVSNISATRKVRCDIGRVQQVASNLISNALDHGAADKPVKVSARTDERELILEVWNAGEPIPQDSLGRIFEPFWQHSGSTNRRGLGLGLYICSQIVRAHGGDLSVSSTREGGTLFSARLPVGSPGRTGGQG